MMLSNGLCNSSSSVREHTHERIVSSLAKLQQGNVRKKGHELLKTTHTHTHTHTHTCLLGFTRTKLGTNFTWTSRNKNAIRTAICLLAHLAVTF